MGCDNEEMLQGNVERFSSSSNKTEPELFSEVGLFFMPRQALTRSYRGLGTARDNPVLARESAPKLREARRCGRASCYESWVKGTLVPVAG